MPSNYGSFSIYDMPLPGSRPRRRRGGRPARSAPPSPSALPEHPLAPLLPLGQLGPMPEEAGWGPLPSPPRPRQTGGGGAPWYDPTTGRVHYPEPTPAPPSQGGGRRRNQPLPGRGAPTPWYDPTTGRMQPGAGTAEAGAEPFGPFPSFEAWEQAFMQEHGRPPNSQDVEDALDSFYFLEVMGRAPTQEEWEVRALTGQWGTYWRGGGGRGGGGRYQQASTGALPASQPWLPGLFSWRI